MSSWVEAFAGRVGAAEDGIRLIAGLIFVYPIMLVHSLFLKRKPATTQHLYFALTGIALAYWTLGVNCLIHNSVCILVTYLVLKVFGGTLATTSFLFVFQLGYLAAGYVVTSNNSYVVNWTMPHCVLCLRLIGVAMDVYDGSKNENELSKYQINSKLVEVPNLLEMTSHVFYGGSYLVGPQHSMTKFRQFIERNIEDGDMSGSVGFGVRRFILGLVYLGGHMAGNALVPQRFILSEEFRLLPYWKLNFYLIIWAKTVLAKYIGAWLLAEGACIISGLAYNGRKDDGTILWNGGANVRLRLFESCYTFTQIIESFNINTNTWCMNYVYKRCKFLNSKLYSQVVTMLFLAVWHGFHSGYYLTFLHEIMVVNFEKQLSSLMNQSPSIQRLKDVPAYNLAFRLVGKLYVLFFIPHCFLPFGLLKASIYLPMLRTTLSPIFLFFGTWPLWKLPLTILLKQPNSRSAPKNQSQTKEDENQVQEKSVKVD